MKCWFVFPDLLSIYSLFTMYAEQIITYNFTMSKLFIQFWAVTQCIVITYSFKFNEGIL